MSRPGSDDGDGGTALRAGLAAFDAGAPVDPHELVGRWRGSEVPTGHPLDGLLGAYRWWGKAFRGPDDVDPLLFEGRQGRVVPLDPRRLPLALAERAPRSPVLGRLSVLAHPLLRTGRPRARLRPVQVRGVLSTAMVYDHLPVLDAFRRQDERTLLGLMDRRGDRQPFLFRLRREG